MLVGSIPPSVINFSHLAEVTVPVKWLTDTVGHPWMGKRDLAPSLLLTVNFSLVSHPLSSLINDCLSAQCNSGKVMETERRLFPVIKEMGAQRGLVSWRPTGNLVVSQSFLVFLYR